MHHSQTDIDCFHVWEQFILKINSVLILVIWKCVHYSNLPTFQFLVCKNANLFLKCILNTFRKLHTQLICPHITKIQKLHYMNLTFAEHSFCENPQNAQCLNTSYTTVQLQRFEPKLYAWKQALALLKPYNTASDDFCVNPGIQLTFGNVTNLFTILIPPLYYTNSRRPFPTR